jgi:hypothetical protein
VRKIFDIKSRLNSLQFVFSVKTQNYPYLLFFVENILSLLPKKIPLSQKNYLHTIAGFTTTIYPYANQTIILSLDYDETLRDDPCMVKKNITTNLDTT